MNDYSPKDVIARLRHERDKYRAMATQSRKNARDMKARKDFLGALKASCRANEYAALASRAAADIARVKAGECIA